MADYFFFVKWIDRVIFAALWWVIIMAFIFYLPFLRPWWWIFLPLFLYFELRKLYLWWIQWDYNYANAKWITLEITPPKEILTPLKAMEDIFGVMWAPLYDFPNWRERWFEGSLPDAPGWMSWEIASIEGKLHFFIRISSSHRGTLESTLYGHYPNLEISEVPDYTKDVPQNIPNDEWDVYGEDFVLTRHPAYPIKTYEKFFEPQGERISAEEKRIDPLSSLLETMARLGPGEQFWLQFITMSVSDTQGETTWKKEAEAIIGKIAKRPVKKASTLSEELGAMANNLIFGPKKEGSGEKATYKWAETTTRSEEGEREMVLTPGEREIITEIENKMKKPVFRTAIRGIYVAKRENWNAGHRILTRAWFSHFQTQHLNNIIFSKQTRPKTQYVFRKRIPFLRSRRMFRNYVLRFPPFFPDRKRNCAVLGIEELATLYHFPVKITGMVMPTMEQVVSKKMGPPPNLPVE